MKNMQGFYDQLASPAGETPKLDRRLPALARFSKARLVAASQENEWYFWEAPQSVTAA